MFGRDMSNQYENLSSHLLDSRSHSVRAGGIGGAMEARSRCLFFYLPGGREQGASKIQALAYQARLAIR